jgi:hypothetical protein
MVKGDQTKAMLAIKNTLLENWVDPKVVKKA